MEKSLFVWQQYYLYGKITDYYLGIAIPDAIIHGLCTDYRPVILGILPLLQVVGIRFSIPQFGILQLFPPARVLVRLDGIPWGFFYRNRY